SASLMTVERLTTATVNADASVGPGVGGGAGPSSVPASFSISSANSPSRSLILLMAGTSKVQRYFDHCASNLTPGRVAADAGHSQVLPIAYCSRSSRWQSAADAGA